MKNLKIMLLSALLMIVSFFNITFAQATKTAVVKMFVNSEGKILETDTTFSTVENIDSLIKTIKCNVVLNDERTEIIGSDSTKYCIYINEIDTKETKRHKCNKEDVKVVVLMNDGIEQKFEVKEINEIITTCCGEKSDVPKCKHIKKDRKHSRENKKCVVISEDSENKEENIKTIEIKENKDGETVIIIIK